MYEEGHARLHWVGCVNVDDKINGGGQHHN